MDKRFPASDAARMRAAIRGDVRSKLPVLVFRSRTNKYTPTLMSKRDPMMATTPPADTPFFFFSAPLGWVDASLPGRAVAAGRALGAAVTPGAAVTIRTNSDVVVAVFVLLVVVTVDVASNVVVFEVVDAVVSVTVVSVAVELELVVVVGFAVVVIRSVVVVSGGSVKPSQAANPSLHVCLAWSTNPSHRRPRPLVP